MGVERRAEHGNKLWLDKIRIWKGVCQRNGIAEKYSRCHTNTISEQVGSSGFTIAVFLAIQRQYERISNKKLD